MLVKLILLFTVTPLIELCLLLEVGKYIGWPAALGIVILTGIVGSILARSQGLRVWRQIQLDMSAGILPTDNLLHGLLILVSGAFLITPGLLTDAAGFLLLVPPVRRILGEYLKRWLRRKIDEGSIRAYTDNDYRDAEILPEETDEK